MTVPALAAHKKERRCIEGVNTFIPSASVGSYAGAGVPVTRPSYRTEGSRPMSIPFPQPPRKVRVAPVDGAPSPSDNRELEMGEITRNDPRPRDGDFFRQLVERAPEPIGIVRDGRLVYANAACLGVFGFPDR